MSRPSPAAREVLSALEAQSPNSSSPTVASVSLPRHYQTASSLLSQARTYQREGSPEHAYILYRRFIVYNLQTLHKHPQYSSGRWDRERAEYRRLCAEAMDQLECIREEIIGKYEHADDEQKEDRDVQREDHVYDSQQPPAAHIQPKQQQQQAAQSTQSTAQDAALEARLSALVLEEQQQREQEKKEDSTYTEQLPIAYRAAEPPDQSLLATAYTMQLPPLPPLPTEPSAPPLEEHEAVDAMASVSSSPPPTAHQQESEVADAPSVDSPVIPVADKSKWSNLRLPVRPAMPTRPTAASPPAAVASSTGPTRPAVKAVQPQSNLSVRPAAGLPTMPSPAVPLAFSTPAAPLRSPIPPPGTITPPVPQLRAAAIVPRSMPAAAVIPQATRAHRPSLPSFTSPALRPLHLPASLMTTFLSYAASNTNANIETCAILAGRLQHNRLTVTHCLIPTQHATASTCSTVDEMELLAVQTKLELLTLGWIHTHPSQSCFLSSIDLHTQYGYQCMMAEAVAIVMAPTDAQRPSGVFSLSPSGMETLSTCDRGGFHEHDTSVGGSLYGTASHVVRDDRVQVAFMDLRRSGPSGGGVGSGGGNGSGGRGVVMARPASVVPAGVASPGGGMYQSIPAPAAAHSHSHSHSHPHPHPHPHATPHQAMQPHAPVPPSGGYGVYPAQYRGHVR